jgi:peptidylprolyl isomerase
MKAITKFLRDGSRRFLQTSLAALLLITFSFSLGGAAWSGTLPTSLHLAFLAKGDAITDPSAILRYALPIDNAAVRELQQSLEETSKYLRGKRWSGVTSEVKDASRVLTLKREDILASVPDEHKPQAETLIAALETGVGELESAVEAKDKEQVLAQRRKLLDQVTQLEELMVQGFPLEVPEVYANLPQLKGRATVEMKTTQGDLTIAVDGYSAPVNAGNFVDLVQRGFYDGLPFIGSEDNFVMQAGDPPGADEGFIDPNTKKYRSIPLEVLIKGDKAPIYGTTLEEAGIYLPELALPFNAYGAVALARPETDPNGGSSQFFFFRFDTELTPPGFNLMDGRYSVFGYLVEGKEVLDKLTDKDKIISAKVVDGLDNLVEPKAS